MGELEQRVSAHFTVHELTNGRGWWDGDPDGESARYTHLALTTLEPARIILGVPMTGISGARPLGHNETGRPSSMHLPPSQRASPALRYMDRLPYLRGAALDFIPHMRCDDAFWALDRAMRNGKLPLGGLFWYAATADNPGPVTGRFIHIDNRGTLARERALTPPGR